LTEKPAFWNYGPVKTTLDLPDELIIAISCALGRCWYHRLPLGLWRPHFSRANVNTVVSGSIGNAV